MALRRIFGLDGIRKLQLRSDLKRFGIFTISSGGLSTYKSLSLLNSLLDEYLQQNNSPSMRKATDIIRDQAFANFNAVDAFYIAYNKEFNAVCNRGFYINKEVKGNNLYKLKPNSIVKINKLNVFLQRFIKDQKYFEEIIMNSLGEKVCEFKSKS